MIKLHVLGELRLMTERLKKLIVDASTINFSS